MKGVLGVWRFSEEEGRVYLSMYKETRNVLGLRNSRDTSSGAEKEFVPLGC